MQVVTDAVRQLLDSYAKVTLTVYIDGEKLDVGVGAGFYSGACAGDDEFSFGNACAASVNITLAASRPDLKGRRIQVKWSVDDTEYPLISGKVSKAKVTAGRTEVEAWDDMYFFGGKAFEITSAVAGTCTAAAAFTAVADAMGVSVETSALALLSGITISGGLSRLGSEATNSAVAGHIAGLVGGNALMSRAGLLTIRQYAAVDWETEPYSGGASAENEDFTVTGITLQREYTVSTVNDDGSTTENTRTAEYSAGDGSLMLANPLSSQAAADSAFAALSAVTVRPGNYSFPGGLLLEPGDIFTVHSMDGSYAVAAGSISMSFDGGVRSSVACGGASEGAEGIKGAINQALAALIADYAKFKKLTADNAEISSAYIEELFTKDITMTGKFLYTSQAYLPPTFSNAIDMLRKLAFPENHPDLPDVDLNGDGVVDEDDCILAYKVADGTVPIHDCAGARKSDVTVCIDLRNAEKTFCISGTNMWGEFIETYIGANANRSTFATRERLDRLFSYDPRSSGTRRILFRDLSLSSSGNIVEYLNPPFDPDVVYSTYDTLEGRGVEKKFDSATGRILWRKDTDSTWQTYAALMGAAPDGYGLGQAVLISASAIDSATAPGWYHISGSMTVNNVTANYWYMHVSAYSSGSNHCVQKLYPVSSYKVELVRFRQSGTWGEWECENPPMTAGVEYRTTERWQGNPVYIKAINFGTLPNSTEKGVYAVPENAEVISVQGYARGPSYNVPIPGYYAIKSMGVTRSTGLLWIETSTDMSSYTGYIVLKYTK